MLQCLIVKPRTSIVWELPLHDFLGERMKAAFKLEVPNLYANYHFTSVKTLALIFLGKFC